MLHALGHGLILAVTLSSIGAASCSTGNAQAPAAQKTSSSRWSHQDWPTGHYRVVEGWPKPLPDTRHSHDGWTWGSFGGVYAESPDRIWIAMRGELPLPAGRQALDALRGAQPVTRKRHGQRGRHLGDLRAGAEARMGAPVPALDHRRGRPGQPRRRMASSRRDVQQAAVRAGSAPDQDQPLRQREARLDHRRPAPHDLPLHLRRQARPQQGPARHARPRTQHVRSADGHRLAA